MNKSIYEQAIKVVTYLQEQDLHLKDTTGTIYISTENITTLENLLIQAQKQEKLLGLYREYFWLNNVTEIEWPTLAYDRALEIKNKIKELENE